MSATLLLRPAGAMQDAVVAQPVRLRDRALARLQAHRLDARLAAGDAADTDPALSLRAQALTSLHARGELARQLHLTVRDAAASSRGPIPIVAPTRRGDVLALAPQLSALAARLTRPGPVAAGGVAQVRLLLTDGTGPLYSRAGDLRAAIVRACDALEPETALV